jgi:hypothetical protein
LLLLSSRCTPGAFTLTSKAAAQATRRRAWAALAARTQAPGSWQQGSAPAVQMERDGVLLHPRNKYIKDPGLDAVIQMQRQRVQRGLDIDKQKRSVSGISGGVLHKQLQLDIIEKEIKILEEVSVCDARATRCPPHAATRTSTSAAPPAAAATAAAHLLSLRSAQALDARACSHSVEFDRKKRKAARPGPMRGASSFSSPARRLLRVSPHPCMRSLARTGRESRSIRT